ncbi:MAG: CoA transferase [Pseudomonadales bacterium]|nr:CoA transferase [Pseudomonadales bacterium]NRA14670.1 CoA transferase [Oceanospirillaceae bacterium]
MTNNNKSGINITGPLAGLRILDLSRILAGPTCTQLLGDMGADVIKVEKPGAGDDTRAWGPPFVTDAQGQPSAESAYYLSANRNKRSIAIDIADPRGARQIRELLVTCDVLIENFKVGGLKKYGLAYADLCKDFPQLVYCSITGFGQTGPNAHRAGYDLLAQGFGGIMSLTGDPQGEPMKVGVGICDVMTGMYASSAILAALYHQKSGGGGQHIDIALVDVQTAWLVNEGTNYLLSGEQPQRRGNQHPNIVPYQVFQVADGHVIVAVGNDGQFVRFCKLLGTPELAMDARFSTNTLRLKNREKLIELLTPMLAMQHKDALLAQMELSTIPGGPINTLPEVFATEQVAAREMKISLADPNVQSGSVELIGNPIKFSATPVSYRRPPPKCGADTEEILAELQQLQSE